MNPEHCDFEKLVGIFGNVGDALLEPWTAKQINSCN